MANDLYAAALPFLRLDGDQAVFGGEIDATWGPRPDFGDNEVRPLAPTEFKVDRRFWEMLDKPDKLVFGLTDEIGWEERVGTKPDSPVVNAWMVATDA